MAQTAPGLYRLFYRSRQTAAVAANLDSVLGGIIGVSIRNNRSVGVTGMLLVVQGYFLQALEGKMDAVQSTYNRILLDPRHSDPHIIAQGPVERRLFAEWNMCAAALAPSDKEILAVLDSKGGFNPHTLTATTIQRLLTTVAEIQRRTALAALAG